MELWPLRTKRRFAFVSTEAKSLSLWARLLDEGHEVCVWIPRWEQARVGDGLVPKAATFEALRIWATHGETTFVFDGPGHGKRAEALRAQGHAVVGAGLLLDRLVADPTDIANSVGLTTLAVRTFDRVADAEACVAQSEAEWEFSTQAPIPTPYYRSESNADLARYLAHVRLRYGDITCTLRERCHGPQIDTAFWFTGEKLLTPIRGAIKAQQFLNGGLGALTECAAVLTWQYAKYSRIAEELQLEQFAFFLSQMHAPPGMYTVHAVIGADKTVRCTGFSPHFSFDTDLIAQRSFVGDLGEMLAAPTTFTDAPLRTDIVQMGVRLTLPPYPSLAPKPPKDGSGPPVWGMDALYADGEHFFVAGGIGLDRANNVVQQDPRGVVGVVASGGEHLGRMARGMLEYMQESLTFPNVQYRTDFAETLSDKARALQQLGFDGPPAVLI